MNLVKRSFSVAGHRTSVALEPEFWDVLTVLAARQGKSLSVLVADIDAARSPERNLASSLRVWVLGQPR
jgi:predicted DNA-binding ribbon-helix-helix protein